MQDPAAIRRLVGARIKTAREQTGRNLRHLSEDLAAAGVSASPQAIFQWERGDTSPAFVNQQTIANVLGKTWAELFAPTDEAAA